MNCARLHLYERSKPIVESGRRTASHRPRRYCQRRMVDPCHEEDPRWADMFQRFHCKSNDDTFETLEKSQTQQHEDLFLSVQNLKFNGDIPKRKRPKTCFKYKALSDGKKHRMFVKQMVEEEGDNAEERSSQLTCYFDDYVKYIVNYEQSAPTAEKSSIVFYSTCKENKAVQVESKNRGVDLKKHKKPDDTPKQKCNKELKETVKYEPDSTSDDTKVGYYKSGKRKCLTISRAQSPETVQVIRVDVVCSHDRGAAISDSENNTKLYDTDTRNVLNPRIINNLSMKTSHFTDKYLLTNTTKTLDENVSGGDKVTLLCKTYRLSSRTTPANDAIKKPETKNKVK